MQITEENIFDLKNKLAIALIEAAEEFKTDIDSSPFDIEDAKLLFDNLVEIMSDISEILYCEDEDEEFGETQKQILKRKLTNYP